MELGLVGRAAAAATEPGGRFLIAGVLRTAVGAPPPLLFLTSRILETEPYRSDRFEVEFGLATRNRLERDVVCSIS